MNDKIMEAAGFGEHVKLVCANKCPFCKKPINMADFTDSTSRKEYRISGLCQACQNDMFEPTPDA